ncbi:MAG: replicative DNA helicase [Bacilli bacterium]|nr:replicative DNA helicase [Bacilli bacterium]
MARSIPNNQEAEQALLSTMFLSKYALDKAVDTLQEDDFYYNNNRVIFNTLVNLANKNIPIDMTSVVTEIKNNDKLNEVGGISYLTEVLNSEAVASNAEYYIKKVSDASLLRRLIKVSEEIQNLGYETNSDVNEVLDEAEKKILNVVKNKQTSEFRNFNEVLMEAQRNLEELSQSKGDVTGLSTGFTDLDRLTSGFHENQLIIVAARPAMGKTIFALNVAVNAALAGKSVAIFNLEMDATQLANRMLSSVGQIEGRKFMSGNLNNDDWTRLNEAVSQLEGAKIFINDTPSATIGEIRSKCRRLASSDDGLDLVVIDYLQLISTGRNYGSNRQQEVSDISRALKLMALELHVPVVALSQLSRSVEQREDKRPLMSDLRESGSIEQDADIVSFLYRDSYYRNKSESKKESEASVSELIVGKHRNGRVATIKLVFKGDTCSFLNYQEEAGE